MLWEQIALIASVVLLGGLLTFYVLGMLSWRTPSTLGLRDGKLAPCPTSPNCVSTLCDDPVKKMDPLPYDGNATDVLTRIKKVLASQPRARIAKEDTNYLHVEYTSLLFRFVDDVEFLIDDHTKVIHFRSASRIGHSDLGANRARMTAFKEAFAKATP